MDQKEVNSSNGKKLKQTQLSFTKRSNHKPNKRKLSDEFEVDDGVKDAKINRINKECVADEVDCCKNECEIHNFVREPRNLLTNDDSEVTLETRNFDECKHARLLNETALNAKNVAESNYTDPNINEFDVSGVLSSCDTSQLNGSSDLNSTISTEETSDIAQTDDDNSNTDTENKIPDCTTPVTLVKGDNVKKLTPKQILRRQEREAKLKEKETLKQEKRKKQEERIQELLRIKAEKKEQKQKQKEEKEKQQLTELTVKNEERRLKEEERKAKDEEKRIKEEAKRAKEDERRAKEERRRKAQEKLTKFFVPKGKSSDQQQHAGKLVDKLEESCAPNFMPFEVKEDMTLAPVARRTLTEECKNFLQTYIITECNSEPKNRLYLSELKTNRIKRRSVLKVTDINFTTDRLEVDGSNNDEELSNNLAGKRFRAKFFKFEENNRPAYRGTWRKSSSIISGRHPFKQDESLLDYNVDSDDEWEDEESGESLRDSEEEKEPVDDYEIDDDIFVPHGYLSDGEGVEEPDSTPRDNLKLDIVKEHFNENSSESRKINTRYFGCIWIGNNVKLGEGRDPIENLLLTFRAVYDDTATPFEPSSSIQQQNFTPPQATTGTTPTSAGNKTKQKMMHLPETYVSDLIKLVHGHRRKAKIIAGEFNEFLTGKGLCAMSFSSIIRKIKEIAVWQKLNESSKPCWCVSDEARKKYDLTESNCATNEELNQRSTLIRTPLSTPSIMKFAKILTVEEREKAFGSSVVESSVTTVASTTEFGLSADEISAIRLKKPIITVYRTVVPDSLIHRLGRPSPVDGSVGMTTSNLPPSCKNVSNMSAAVVTDSVAVVDDNHCAATISDDHCAATVSDNHCAAAVSDDHCAAAVSDNHCAAAVSDNHCAAAVSDDHCAATVSDNHCAAAVSDDHCAAIVGDNHCAAVVSDDHCAAIVSDNHCAAVCDQQQEQSEKQKIIAASDSSECLKSLTTDIAPNQQRQQSDKRRIATIFLGNRK